MSKSDWHEFIDENGDFSLPEYIYTFIKDLMKESLDLGTLLSDDPKKLRAFKEQIKQKFKSQWFQVAEALETFDMIIACSCKKNEYCKECGGSRYILNPITSPDVAFEIGAFTMKEDPDLEEKLKIGHQKALEEVQRL